MQHKRAVFLFDGVRHEARKSAACFDKFFRVLSRSDTSKVVNGWRQHQPIACVTCTHSVRGSYPVGNLRFACFAIGHLSFWHKSRKEERVVSLRFKFRRAEVRDKAQQVGAQNQSTQDEHVGKGNLVVFQSGPIFLPGRVAQVLYHRMLVGARQQNAALLEHLARSSNNHASRHILGAAHELSPFGRSGPAPREIGVRVAIIDPATRENNGIGNELHRFYATKHKHFQFLAGWEIGRKMIAFDAIFRLERSRITHQHYRCRIFGLHRLKPWLKRSLDLRKHAFPRLELDRTTLQINSHSTLLFAASRCGASFAFYDTVRAGLAPESGCEATNINKPRVMQRTGQPVRQIGALANRAKHARSPESAANARHLSSYTTKLNTSPQFRRKTKSAVQLMLSYTMDHCVLLVMSSGFGSCEEQRSAFQATSFVCSCAPSSNGERAFFAMP